MEGNNSDGKAGVAAVDRALMLLDVFHDAKSSLSLADLAQRTGLFKSTILRLAASLQKHRYLHRVESGRYVLGGAAFDLGNAYRRTFSLIDLVRPVLEQLAANAHESASFWVLENGHRVCICRVESSQDLRDALFREGEHRELDKGPTSTLLRAFSGEKGKRFEEVRREATAVSIGLYRPDIAGIACPAFGPGEALAGAVTLTGPSSRFTGATLDRKRKAASQAAVEITLSLSGRNPYQPNQEK